jgi:hypothetical protein
LSVANEIEEEVEDPRFDVHGRSVATNREGVLVDL